LTVISWFRSILSRWSLLIFSSNCFTTLSTRFPNFLADLDSLMSSSSPPDDLWIILL
jgi:hypothetical protein